MSKTASKKHRPAVQSRKLSWISWTMRNRYAYGKINSCRRALEQLSTQVVEGGECSGELLSAIASLEGHIGQCMFLGCLVLCPVCSHPLQSPFKCILGGDCLFSPWDGPHTHQFCMRCNCTILADQGRSGEICYVPPSRVQVNRKHGRRR